MKKLTGFLIILSILAVRTAYTQNVAITDDAAYDADPSAMLDIKSTSKGMLVPRVTTIQRLSIATPATGLLVFDTNFGSFYFFDGTGWVNLSSGNASGIWSKNGSNVYLTNSSDNLGIGTNAPVGKLEVKGDVALTSNQPLFEVINSNGDTVFAVYSQGVHIRVGDDPLVKAGASKGGFAVGGFSLSKGFTNEYMRVSPDSVRVYINEDQISKAGSSKGGFAVGGYSVSKGITDDYLIITDDSSRVFTNGNGGFEISDLSQGSSNYMNITPTNYYIGHESGLGNLTGSFNSYYGYQSGRNTVAGSRNILIGYQSGMNSTGDDNMFTGYQSGFNNNGNYNTLSGYQCGYGNLGSSNSFYGYQSGYGNSGSNNVFFGYKCGYTNSGVNNVFLGNEAGRYNTSGYKNVFAGNQSGYSNTTGRYNVFIGNNCGRANIDGFVNVFVGESAGYSNTTGTNNIFVGESAGYSTLSQNGNIFMGRDAGYFLTYGWGNTFIGHVVGENITSGVNNVIVGTYAGNSKTQGNSNVLVGPYAGENNGTGTENIFVGPWAGRFATGSYNLFLGGSAGYNATGSSNIFIGEDAGSNETGSNLLYIDNTSTTTPLIYGNFSTNALVVNGSFKVTGTLYDDDGDAGTNGQVMTSTGSGSNWTTLSYPSGSGASNRVAFWTGASTLSSNSDLYWDNTNSRLGVGITPGYKIHAIDYSTSADAPAVYGDHTVTSGWGIGVKGVGWYYGVEGLCDNTSGGTGVHGNSYCSSGYAYGLYGTASGSGTGNRYGIYATASGGATAYAGYFSGNVHVSGTLSKSAGTFKIDHPQDPENKYLVHSFVESPEMMNLYNGIVTLDNNGNANVNLPEYFNALNKDFRYTLTPIGAPGPNLYIGQEIANNQFTISGGQPGMKVSWMVTGVRKDPYALANPIIPVVEKANTDKGKYLNPEIYNQPASKAIHAIEISK